MSDLLRVARVADLLARYPEEKITRANICHAVNTRSASMNKRTLTRLWPEIQAVLGERGLYLGRPIGKARLDYGCCATTSPLLALLGLEDREKNVVTRLDNDVRGEVMQRIVASQGQGSVSAALQLERARAYLASFRQNEIDMNDLYNMAVRAYNDLPWRAPVGADILPWDA